MPAREKAEFTTVQAQDVDDNELIERFLAGERRAFDQLMRRHERPIYYLAMRYLKDHDEASDIMQRTFLKAFEKLDRFERRSQFRTWLFRIAVNLCKNRIRDKGRWQKVDPVEDVVLEVPSKAEGTIEREQRQAMLERAVEKLPPKQRQTLELRVFNDLSFKEIAEVMGCSENAAKVNYHYAVKRIVQTQGQPS